MKELGNVLYSPFCVSKFLSHCEQKQMIGSGITETYGSAIIGTNIPDEFETI